ncbi:hypothetical protein HC776_01625 [bacterium]|nr:hypothetical protein [bacterium]
MLITFDWYDSEHSAFYVLYKVGWTWDEHHQILAQLRQWADREGLAKTLGIFDLRGTTLPSGSLAKTHYSDPRPGSHIIILMDHMVARTITQIAILALRKQHLFTIVSTEDEAKALLEFYLNNHVTS